MRGGAAYLLAHALVVLAGLPVFALPACRPWGLPARFATAFAVGAVVLSVEAIVSSMLGLAWNAVALLAAPAIATLFLVWKTRRLQPRVPAFRPGVGIAAFALLVGVLSFGHLALSLATARATSVDFLLSWGVKGVRFAEALAIDPELLRWRYFGHAQPFYPPLVPVLDAWGVLAAGRMTWRAAPLVTVLWLGAAAVLLLQILRQRLADREATILAAFWTAALACSLVYSFSGASAETPLLLYVTIGALLLLTEGPEPVPGRRVLSGIFLAGAVLTKVEGSVAVALLIASAGVRDRMMGWRDPARRLLPLALPPLLAALLWGGFLLRFHVPVAYFGRGSILEFHFDRLLSVLVSVVRNLQAGTHGLSWIVPLLLLLLYRGRVRFREILPGVATVAGLLAFYVLVYLHEPRDPTTRIIWEVPRLSQLVLSLWIAAIGLVTLSSHAAQVSEEESSDLGAR